MEIDTKTKTIGRIVAEVLAVQLLASRKTSPTNCSVVHALQKRTMVYNFRFRNRYIIIFLFFKLLYSITYSVYYDNTRNRQYSVLELIYSESSECLNELFKFKNVVIIIRSKDNIQQSTSTRRMHNLMNITWKRIENDYIAQRVFQRIHKCNRQAT